MGQKGDIQYVFCHPATMIRVFIQYAAGGRGGEVAPALSRPTTPPP
jgi:hypothetical protein